MKDQPKPEKAHRQTALAEMVLSQNDESLEAFVFYRNAQHDFQEEFSTESPDQIYNLGLTGWTVFAALHQRVAYLLYQLSCINKEVDQILWQVTPRSKQISTEVLENAQAYDPFEYFIMLDILIQQQIGYRVIVVDLGSRETEGWRRIQQRWCLDILKSGQIEKRREILVELYSTHTLSKVSGAIRKGKDEIFEVLRHVKVREIEYERFVSLATSALTRSFNIQSNNLELAVMIPADLKSEPNGSKEGTLDISAMEQLLGPSNIAPSWSKKVYKFLSSHRAKREKIHHTLAQLKLASAEEVRETSTSQSREDIEDTETTHTYSTADYDGSEVGIEVFSSTKCMWIKTSALLDTGLRGGNFVSHKFLQDILEMKYESTSEDTVPVFDTANGKFSPLGTVELRWLGRNRREDGSVRKGAKQDTMFYICTDPSVDVILGWETIEELGAITVHGLYRTYMEKKTKRTSSKADLGSNLVFDVGLIAALAQKANDAAELCRRQAARDALAAEREGTKSKPNSWVSIPDTAADGASSIAASKSSLLAMIFDAGKLN